jgi:hypothetical protein
MVDTFRSKLQLIACSRTQDEEVVKQAKAKGKNGQTITEPTPANLDFHIALAA